MKTLLMHPSFSQAALAALLALPSSAQSAPPGSLPVVTPGFSRMEASSNFGIAQPLDTVTDTESQTGSLLPLATFVQHTDPTFGTLSHELTHSNTFTSARSGVLEMFTRRTDTTQFGTASILGSNGEFRYEFSVDVPTTLSIDFDALFTESNPGNSWWAMPRFHAEVNGVHQTAAMPFLPPKPFSPQVIQNTFVFTLPAGNSYLRIDDGNGASGNQWGGVRELTVRAVWRIGPPLEWADLGHGLAGGPGVPQLSGTGSLIAGSPYSTQLSNALPNTSATLVLGLSALYAPLKGGVLVPMVDVLTVGIATDGNGEVHIAGTWPDGLPQGFSVYAQYWMADPAGPAGFSASNGVLAQVP